MTMRVVDGDHVVVPAGKYLLGDPHYIVSGATWTALLESSSHFASPIGVTPDGAEVVAFSTAHGDGVYADDQGHRYPVKSGLIGLYPSPACFLPNERADRLLHVVHFSEPTSCSRDRGILHFGPITINTDEDTKQDQTAGESPAADGSTGAPTPVPHVGSAQDATQWSKSIWRPDRSEPPDEPYELRIPTLDKGTAYDVDWIMLHAMFGLLCWFLDNEYPGLVKWPPADVQELAELRQWWETRWNMQPINYEAESEMHHMLRRLVEISPRLWV